MPQPGIDPSMMGMGGPPQGPGGPEGMPMPGGPPQGPGGPGGPQQPQQPSPEQMQQMMQQAEEMKDQEEKEQRHREVQKMVLETNIADGLTDEELFKIGSEAWDGWMLDRGSRQVWFESVSKAISMALLVKEVKTTPWPGASNVKYPLIATAALQFGARAYPTLVPSNGKLVKAKVIGMDKDGQKKKRGSRIEKHMSYQFLDEMEEWEEQMDKTLFICAIAGCAFKKTYFDSILKRNMSVLVHPKDLVVSYWAKSLETAPRISEELELSENDVYSRELGGIFIEQDYGSPKTEQSFADKDRNRTKMDGLLPPSADETTPFHFVEQHCWLDLDEDGYREPYIVTFEQTSKKVARIVARFTADDIVVNDKGKVVQIKPVHFYTKFPFFPNPDGGFYDIGFGQLMAGINDSIDTLINQLIDSGTLNNLQSGWISKALKIKAGDNKFKPGEWKQVPLTSDDIKKAIMPMPSKEPSAVLSSLLQLMITSGKELASISEIFVGKMPGQNTPAYTTKETVEQGMKLFTAIYKRIYRAMYSEFRKVYRLNGLYMEPEHAVQIMDEPMSNKDYDLNTIDIMPAADPNAASMTERASKFSGILQLMSLGELDPKGVTAMGLEVLDLTEPEMAAVLRKEPKQPPPEAQKMQMEMKMKQEDHQMKQQQAQQAAQMKMAEAQQKVQTTAMMAKIKTAEGSQRVALEKELGAMKLKFESIKAGLTAQANIQKAQANTVATHMGMQVKQAEHAQKLRHIKQQAKAKPKGGGR